MQLRVKPRIEDLRVIWGSLGFNEKLELGKRYGLFGYATTEDIARYFPDLAAHLLGGLL
jgi:hypothetical protein